jgi:hypothetical protein
MNNIKTRIFVLRDVTTCNLLELYLRFGGTYCPHFYVWQKIVNESGVMSRSIVQFLTACTGECAGGYRT